MTKLLQEKNVQMFGQVNREFRDLNIEELVHGYTWSQKNERYMCIFCGEMFEEGVIYPFGSRLMTAERAVKEHVAQQHGNSFACLLSMDKQINGLTQIQKQILHCFYEGKENDEICQLMDITPATVRTHRHNLQRMKREAKILLALMEQMEKEDRPPLPDRRVETRDEKMVKEKNINQGNIPVDFSGNSLHPFFTQRKLE